MGRQCSEERDLRAREKKQGTGQYLNLLTGQEALLEERRWDEKAGQKRFGGMDWFCFLETETTHW